MMEMPSLSEIKERINLAVYDYSKMVNVFINRFVMAISFIALGLLSYYTGFDIPPAYVRFVEPTLDIFLVLFSLEFITRLVFEVHRRKFLRGNFLEAVLAMVIGLELLSSYLLGFSLFHAATNFLAGSEQEDSYHIAKQLAIVLLAGSEIFTQGQKIFSFSIKPAALFLLSFVGISLLGAIFLTLPEMTVSDEGISFLDALFTSTSATCVTGLIVVDTGSFFTFKGHVVILLLMQVGGIGIITFASFFAVFLKQGIGIRHQIAVTDIFGSQNFKSTTSLLRQIVLFTLLIESVGAILIYSQMGNAATEVFYNKPFLKAFYAVFHAVSAFCNAGFSLYSNSLMHETIQNDYFLISTFGILIILGGIGFPVLRDLFSPAAIKKRKKLKWKKWETGTTIAVYTSLILIVLGAILFYFLENNGTLTGENMMGDIVHSIFQSLTTRTAGFNSMDIATIGIPTVIFFLFLMFIGGSSTSTAGGIKTSTFVVIMRSVVSVIRNKPQVELKSRAISRDLIYRAFAIFAFAVMFQFIGIFLLTITEPQFNTLDVIFELVSAFNTVGLSRGITADLSETGKAIITAFMFIGRVGSLTLAFALSSPAKTTNYRYPSAHFMVG